MIENEKMKKKIAEMNAIDDAEKQRKKDMAVAMTKEIVASNKKLGVWLFEIVFIIILDNTCIGIL